MLSSDTNNEFCRFGEIYTVKNIRILSKKSKQIHYNENLEHLHKSRVATRKLRSALENFKDCYPEDQHKEWLKELKSVTGILGKSRDLDVQIDFLKKFLTQTEQVKYHEGIKRLILRLTQRRKEQQPKILRGIENLFGGKFFGHFGKISYRSSKAGFAQTPAVYAKIHEIVKVRIDQILQYSRDIHDPAKIAELHEMRKKNKQLRYTLELFKQLFVTRLDYYILRVTELHDILGLIHDSDVWTVFIPEFSAKEKKRTEKFFGNALQFKMIKPGLDYLLKERKSAREKDYNAFLKMWNSLQAEDFWGKLPGVIEDTKNKSIAREKTSE